MPETQSALFDIKAVEDSITGTEFAGYLVHLASVGSTNDLALEAAQRGARSGVWIADEQTKGRGRGSHSWHSAAGDGLYMTALTTPPVPMQNALGLSLRTAIAVQSAIASVTGFSRPDEIDIRWPNDLILKGRKCGGILIETAVRPSLAGDISILRYAVIGIGINCNHTSFPPEIDAIATSLRREMPDPSESIPREPLAAAILLALDEEIRLMMTDDGYDRKPAEYSTWIEGKRVHVDEDGGYTGITSGTDPDGFLLVAGDDGRLHTVRSGGVRAELI